MFDFSELKQKSKDVEEWLTKELSVIRTGRATPTILDFVQVESYGSKMSIKELANMIVEDAKTGLRLYQDNKMLGKEGYIFDNNEFNSWAKSSWDVRTQWNIILGRVRVGSYKFIISADFSKIKGLFTKTLEKNNDADKDSSIYFDLEANKKNVLLILFNQETLEIESKNLFVVNKYVIGIP